MRAPLVIDLDGVVRLWNPQHVADIERRHGLPVGSLFGAAFADNRLSAAITGQVTDAHWRAPYINMLFVHLYITRSLIRIGIPNHR